MKRAELRLSVGLGGWVAARVGEPGAQTSYVHFVEKKGKLVRSGWVFANAQRPEEHLRNSARQDRASRQHDDRRR